MIVVAMGGMFRLRTPVLHVSWETIDVTDLGRAQRWSSSHASKHTYSACAIHEFSLSRSIALTLDSPVLLSLGALRTPNLFRQSLVFRHNLVPVHVHLALQVSLLRLNYDRPRCFSCPRLQP